MTDVEVFETQYPARLRQFAIRQNAGGQGKHNGGDGVIREIEFLKDLEVSMLTQRRVRPPFGLDGGEPGSVGKNQLKRAVDDNVIDLGSLVQVSVKARDVLTIQTPGGGGFGKGD